MLIWTSHEVASRDGTGAGAEGAGAGAPDLLDGEDTSTSGRSAATADVTGLVLGSSVSSAAADCGAGLGGGACDDDGIFM